MTYGNKDIPKSQEYVFTLITKKDITYFRIQ